MPRMTIPEEKKKECALKGVLEEYIFKYNYSDEFLAEKLNMTVRTFKTKRKSPRLFKVSELIDLMIILRIPQDINMFYRLTEYKKAV